MPLAYHTTHPRVHSGRAMEPSAGEVLYETGDEDEEYTLFLMLHAVALKASGIPPLYWRSLQRKLSAEVFDAGEVFGMVREEEEEEEQNGVGEERKPRPPAEVSCKVIVMRESGLQVADPHSVFLVDHAWTYRAHSARTQLEQHPGLLARMAALMGLDFHGEVPDPDVVEQVLELMWKYNQTYQLSQGSAEEKMPVWYIMDEFGSQVQHACQPTCSMAPFFYIAQQVAYSVLWPLRDLACGEEVTRDYVYGESDPLIRQCRMLPWKPRDLRHVSSVTPEPSDLYYETIARENKETLPIQIQPSHYSEDNVFKVYTEMEQVQDNLTHPRFQLVDSPEEADILWMFSHIRDYRKLSEERPHVMLNQFPCETVVTAKDCLAAVARKAGRAPAAHWLPHTFNLNTELPQFISHYQQNEHDGMDNFWICKPWNLARGLDTHITGNLSYIIRQRESTPKVVCKYVEEPVLFRREEVGLVKFDIRYMVLLRSVQPLRLYVYKVFWLRFANRPFSLDHFDDYQKHFTVMNYADGVPLKQVHYDDFIPMFEGQYPAHPWEEVQEEIFKAFAELFHAASSRPAPYGICAYPSSRAIYAIDLMLKWAKDSQGLKLMKPQILEVNFSPDCGRACKYHPNFYNHVFQTLFLDEPQICPVTRIV